MKLLFCLILPLSLAACGRHADDYLPGYAEGEYVRVASPVGGTLTRVFVRSGDQVAQGAPAFVLEQDAERAEREEAVARVRRATAQLLDARKGQRPDELAAVRAQVKQAQAAYELAAADLARQQALIQARFIAPARLDEARAALMGDRARVDQLRAQLRVAQLGSRADAIAAAEQDRKAAEAQLAQAEWKLAQKAKTLPQAGAVTEVFYREGELVPAGAAVVSLLPPANIKARFFVAEPQLAKLAPGRRVLLSCDGCGAPLAATVSFIAPGAEFTSPLIYSRENRASLVFMVEARPAPGDAARLHPGQPLEVRLAAQ
ncbi:MAG: Secretion protein HlyD [Massilia sp.]|jgi:HlyD family secretion protein|nr:Secretion protein HlyD [Massilia sp.]